MDENNEALFSLELAVEKLYVPHTTCRFPAVAVRLLDFPTIVVKHVEDDLAGAIRQKISFESSHHIPEQFHELKDRHGNFLVKKGKSCLFRMTPEVLKQHLVTTPLYVMIIDLFPKVPKLLGNITIPLDSLINLVLVDIAKLGPTVPSVHGDKGLFKLCNLMGNEIGYIVLGFRLLCLGPSLIPHLPHSALAQMSFKKIAVEEKKIEQIFNMNKCQEGENNDQERAIEVRDSFSMTEPMKQDVLLQTVELEEKAVNVNILPVKKQSEEPSPTNLSPASTNVASTQTEKIKILKESHYNVNKKWIERDDMKVEDDGIIINNIVCPPPLFYNSEGAPVIKIERLTGSKNNQYDDISVEDLSEIDSFDGFGLGKKQTSQEEDEGKSAFEKTRIQKHKKEEQKSQIQYKSETHIPQARYGEKVYGLPVAPRKETVFPLISALINELSCIQDPQFLLDISRKLHISEGKIAANQPLTEKKKIEQNANIGTPAVIAAVASALTRKLETSENNLKETRKDEVKLSKKDQSKTLHTAERYTPKERPESGKRKSKLVYGITNTQRLRLQKANPNWLKNVDKDLVNTKSRREKRDIINDDEINVTNFSDTLTEVRRLAEKELNSTAGGDTLQHIASEVEEFESTYKPAIRNKNLARKSFPSPHKTQIIKPGISKKSPPTTQKVNRIAADRRNQHSLSRSSTRTSVKKSSTRGTPPRSQHRIHQRVRRRDKLKIDDSSDSDELLSKKRPVPLERHMFGITSPSLEDNEQRSNDYEDVLSARSDLPSSRSRSIDVRLPSADPDLDDNATISDDEDRTGDENEEEDDIPLPDDSMQGEPRVQELNFPRYVSREMSLPESIDGNPNASLNLSGEATHNSPLESTRQSKNMTEEQNESRVLQSTDYDTRQFHSTDEPELQGLISEDENQSGAVHSGAHSLTSVRMSQKFPVINPQLSENSPVPSVRRSTTKLDAGAHSYLPSMSLSKGQISPTSSRPSTPKMTNYRKATDLEPIHKNIRGNITPRSSTSSPRRQTPRSRRQIMDYKTSIHTDSVSSYMPSDPENVLVSLSTSNSGNYSDDFQPLASGESGDGNSSVEQLPRIIPARKLGYTIT